MKQIKFRLSWEDSDILDLICAASCHAEKKTDCLYIVDGYIVCISGYVMHFTKNFTGLADGVYTVPKLSLILANKEANEFTCKPVDLPETPDLLYLIGKDISTFSGIKAQVNDDLVIDSAKDPIEATYYNGEYNPVWFVGKRVTRIVAAMVKP